MMRRRAGSDFFSFGSDARVSSPVGEVGKSDLPEALMDQKNGGEETGRHAAVDSECEGREVAPSNVGNTRPLTTISQGLEESYPLLAKKNHPYSSYS